MSSTSTSLVSIKEKYKADGVHLLLPTVFEEQLNPFHKLAVMEVTADLSPNSGDTFKVGGQYVKVQGKKDAWTEFYSPAKPLLMKIATAAGIQFNPSFSGVTNPSKNVYHGKAHGAIKLPDGTYKTHYDEKIINLEDEEDKFRVEFMDKSIEGVTGKASYEAAKLFKGEWVQIDKKNGERGEKERAYKIHDCDRQKFIDRSVLVNMVLQRKHAPQKALTGAILRVIRALIGMKGQYTREELKKPFVLARVNFSPDFNDPEVRAAMLQQGMSSMVNIFGNQPPQISAQPVFMEDDSVVFDQTNIEDDPFISENSQSQNESAPVDTSVTEPPPPPPAPAPASAPPPETHQNVCHYCGINITEGVAKFSMNKFKIHLCMKCQNGGV